MHHAALMLPALLRWRYCSQAHPPALTHQPPPLPPHAQSVAARNPQLANASIEAKVQPALSFLRTIMGYSTEEVRPSGSPLRDRVCMASTPGMRWEHASSPLGSLHLGWESEECT